MIVWMEGMAYQGLDRKSMLCIRLRCSLAVDMKGKSRRRLSLMTTHIFSFVSSQKQQQSRQVMHVVTVVVSRAQ